MFSEIVRNGIGFDDTFSAHSDEFFTLKFESFEFFLSPDFRLDFLLISLGLFPMFTLQNPSFCREAKADRGTFLGLGMVFDWQDMMHKRHILPFWYLPRLHTPAERAS